MAKMNYKQQKTWSRYNVSGRVPPETKTTVMHGFEQYCKLFIMYLGVRATARFLCARTCINSLEMLKDCSSNHKWIIIAPSAPSPILANYRILSHTGNYLNAHWNKVWTVLSLTKQAKSGTRYIYQSYQRSSLKMLFICVLSAPSWSRYCFSNFLRNQEKMGQLSVKSWKKLAFSCTKWSKPWIFLGSCPPPENVSPPPHLPQKYLMLAPPLFIIVDILQAHTAPTTSNYNTLGQKRQSQTKA